METPVFLLPMAKAHPGETLEDSQNCVFYTPLQGEVQDLRIGGSDGALTVEFTYGEGDAAGRCRLTQMGSNLLLEEPPEGAFQTYLKGLSNESVGHILLYALRFKFQDLSRLFQRGGTEELKDLEDRLDTHLDNAGAYDILDFRRTYATYGDQLISIEEFLALVGKGYYPNTMNASRILAGRLELEFRFVMERYNLVKDVLIKDMDTYTSIINNNIARNTRLLTIVSLVGVALNFLLAAFLSASPIVGVVACLAVGALTGWFIVDYRTKKRLAGPAKEQGSPKMKVSPKGKGEKEAAPAGR